MQRRIMTSSRETRVEKAIKAIRSNNQLAITALTPKGFSANEKKRIVNAALTINKPTIVEQLLQKGLLLEQDKIGKHNALMSAIAAKAATSVRYLIQQKQAPVFHTPHISHISAALKGGDIEIAKLVLNALKDGELQAHQKLSLLQTEKAQWQAPEDFLFAAVLGNNNQSIGLLRQKGLLSKEYVDAVPQELRDKMLRAALSYRNDVMLKALLEMGITPTKHAETGYTSMLVAHPLMHAIEIGWTDGITMLCECLVTLDDLHFSHQLSDNEARLTDAGMQMCKDDNVLQSLFEHIENTKKDQAALSIKEILKQYVSQPNPPQQPEEEKELPVRRSLSESSWPTLPGQEITEEIAHNASWGHQPDLWKLPSSEPASDEDEWPALAPKPTP